QDRWQRVNHIFGAALERPAEEREAFVEKACVDDEELWREVRSLLAARAEAGGFLSTPQGLKSDTQPRLAPGLSSTGAHLSTGTRFGPYEIVSFLAAGGMGEVYKARDTRLDRTVAIKVLPGDLVADADRTWRFEREARAISKLNHPHICALYDVGRHD